MLGRVFWTMNTRIEEKDLNVLALVKGSERYVFLWTEGYRSDIKSKGAGTAIEYLKQDLLVTGQVAAKMGVI